LQAISKEKTNWAAPNDDNFESHVGVYVIRILTYNLFKAFAR
jgi:hypothetical protein